MDGLNRLIESLDKPAAGQYRDTVARIAIEGRAVTHVAQNLKHCFPDFEQWYEDCRIEMEGDPLCKFFYKLRTDKLKHGDDQISSFSLSNRRKGFNFSISGGNIVYSFQNEKGEHIKGVLTPPKDSAGCFIDSNGVGWNILNKDGSTAKRYAELPMHQIGIDLWYGTPPQVHKGMVIEDTSAENLCRLYVNFLNNFFQKLEAKFFRTNKHCPTSG
jgi:hypothetical protein